MILMNGSDYNGVEGESAYLPQVGAEASGILSELSNAVIEPAARRVSLSASTWSYAATQALSVPFVGRLCPAHIEVSS